MVANGYKQKLDVDDKEVYALVVRLDIIRLLKTLAFSFFIQIDVKPVCLHGDLNELIFILIILKLEMNIKRTG